MKQTLALGAFAVAGALSLGGGVSAQEAAKAAEAKNPRIAVIDMGEVSEKSLLGKSYKAELEKLRDEIEASKKKIESEVVKFDAALKALQDEIQKQGQVLSPEALEKKNQEFTRKSRERQALGEDGEMELRRMTARAQEQAQRFNAEFQGRIRPHIEAVVKDKGIDVVIDSQVTITVNKAFDISQDVIIKADDAERAAKAKPAAATPPSKPAGNPR
jgi:Skp family chaperone for outer membrane proteins